MARTSTDSDNGSTRADTADTADSKKTTRKKSAGRRPGRRESNAIESSGGAPGASRMIVNYIPGDECRIAFVEDGKLEEYHAEPTGSTSRVNNIYFGVVRNVNTAVQAAFIDFGLDEHGFLHTTDVHPRYFPKNEDAAERVGIKTPRRDRPPIQKCFKPGDRIMVQVLKEGVGTKGPTLTSYISIPGRYLVMMPGMDNVGVSRKVEDDEQRRAMRKVLDQLELPEGFGFILRTAGMERTKAELNRDLSYLKRLWADMDKRQKGKKAPLALYAESDLLLRALRDLAGTEVTDIIIDDPSALARAERFIKIASPRSRPRLRQYTGRAPIFAAFGIEQQIHNIHSREVPLPSGGRLIFDETEALVAIDVNSGRSRGARDAESNAFNTNMEAADEICRQLRLRDMGGLVISDLIDMRHASNRKAIEQRFAERLKRDRAKSTILPISEFGLLEMTRQRMRSSHERTHFAECSLCKGRGVIRRPDSVAAEALRDLSLVASHEKVARVEMVVSAQVASHLLSGRRKQLSRIERVSGVITEVRVSENMAAERFVLHAYDASNNDIDLEKLPRLPNPEQFLVEAEGLSEADASLAESIDERHAEAFVDDEDHDDPHAVEAHPIELDADFDEQETGEDRGGRRRRRRRRRRGGGGSDEAAQADTAGHAGRHQHDDDDDDHDVEDHDDAHDHQDAGEHEDDDHRQTHGPEADGEDRPQRKRRRRRRRGGRGRTGAEADDRDDRDDRVGHDTGDDRPARDSRDSREPRDSRESGRGEPDSLARRLASALSTPVHQPSDDHDEDDDGDDGVARHDAEATHDEAHDDTGPRRKRRRRRRRGGRRDDAVATGAHDEGADHDHDDHEDHEDHGAEAEAQTHAGVGAQDGLDTEADQGDADRPRRKRRRRRGGRDRTDGARADHDGDDSVEARHADHDRVHEDQIDEDHDADHDEAEDEAPTVEVVAAQPEPEPAGMIEPSPRRGRRSRGDDDQAQEAPKADAKPRPRFLYSAHRKTKPGGPAGPGGPGLPGA
jgi:ribonuclease E